MKYYKLLVDIFFTIILFCIIGISIYFIGSFLEPKTKNKVQNKPIIEKQTDNDNSNMPYIPEFGPGSGTAIYPDKGILIIKFPDNVKMIVEQEGCQ